MLVGATASGKSAIGHAMAMRSGSLDIVSADAMQVYRGMDIGTAKPSAVERAEVGYHLVDLIDPQDDFNVSDFQYAARQAFNQIEQRSRRCLVVGGTGLYVRAITDGLTMPGHWPAIRSTLEQRAATELHALYDELAQLDPSAAAKIEPTNDRRIVRALEVCLGSGKPFSSFGPGLDTYAPVGFPIIGVRWSRSALRERIERRVHAMVADGFVDEVRSLRERPAGWSRTARQALGYREFDRHLAGEISLSTAIDETVLHTCQFAVRQDRWFRRDPRIRWIDIERDAVAEALPILLELCNPQ